jgi:CBS-domain-containing membrane protein
MHDRKLLSNNELDGAELSGQTVPAIQSTKPSTMRASFWAVIGFCVTGLVCSIYVPSSYLHLEQTAALLR